MYLALRHPTRLLGGALALGGLADYLFYGRWLGLSVPLFVALGLALLFSLTAAEGQRPSRANLWLAGAALLFALLVALRSAPVLVVLNLTAVLGLLLLLVGHYRGAALLQLSLSRVSLRTLAALGRIGLLPMPLGAQAVRAMPVNRAYLRRLAPFGRGLLLATPVLLCFGGLLVSADQVFASYLSDLWPHFTFDPRDWLGHTSLVLVSSYLCAGGILAALGSPDASSDQPARRHWPAEGETQPLHDMPALPLHLGVVEALTVLGLVDLLFGGFMLVQGAYLFGGMDTLDRSQMTYADYARRGFFELLTVTCLALALLGGLMLLTRRNQPWQRRAFAGAGAALLALMLGLLASAFQRLLLYEAAYGYTQLRLYTHSFMIWLAVVLLIVLVALLSGRGRLVLTGGFVSALLYLAALNFANPDAMIVRENVARYQTLGKLDVDYLSQLSADAMPALVEALPQIRGVEAALLRSHLRRQHNWYYSDAAESGWPAWHAARARALWALDQGLMPGG